MNQINIHVKFELFSTYECENISQNWMGDQKKTLQTGGLKTDKEKPLLLINGFAQIYSIYGA